MDSKQNKLPAIVWLKVTDYMHAWLQYELGGTLRIREQRVISIQHLPRARELMRTDSVEDTMKPAPVGLSMSATMKNCIDAGLELNDGTVERMYGISKESIKLFMPVECPPMRITTSGVVRPWTLLTNFGRRQASDIQNLLRDEFWNAVKEYNDKYAKQMNGEKYTAVKMIEGFCQKTKTPEMYVEAMRREWQRRVKRGGCCLQSGRSS